MKIKLDCPYEFIDKNFINSLELSKNPDCLIVNPGIDGFLSKDYFEKYPNIKVVGTPSTGVNHIDQKYLKENSIKFFSLLDDREFLENIHASAEFTWLHIMNIVRKFSLSISYIRLWRRLSNENYLRSTELYGKTLGIIGFGRIGRKIEKYAKAFGLKVKFYDPYVSGSCLSIQDLSDCDIISINCYLNSETKNLISNDIFKDFKDGIFIINTSRGEVVDEEYVAKLIKNNKIHYSCDVLKGEQDMGELYKSPLLHMFNKQYYDANTGESFKTYPNLVITPHVAGVTTDSQEKALKSIVGICKKCMK